MAQAASSDGRTPFYLVESDHSQCINPSEPQTEIVATDSVTKQEYGVKWTKAPSSCFIVKKVGDKSVSSDFEELALWLRNEKGVRIYVEARVHDEEFPEFEPFDVDSMGSRIDFIVVLGGDGTLLFTASLFQNTAAVPPIISFARGSLGFLTPFEFKNHRQILSTLTAPNEPHWVSVRMRLRAKVFRRKKAVESQNVAFPETTELSDGVKTQKQLVSEHGVEQKSDGVDSANIYAVGLGVDDDYQCIYDQQALNEVLIERTGSVTAMIMLEVHVDRKRVTTVQADGLIISSPTGSTAYSVSAGGSLIAPNVPCIGLTPICPHTLSFRPVVLADSSVIHVTVHRNARTLPKISLDGKFPLEMERGDIVQIQSSQYPVPTFKLDEFQHEWWDGLVTKFNWNVRDLQK